MYALADCNNFYVSCERVFNPGLNNKPVVVLSNNDGCIISRSNEAKALGIKMAEPVFKIRDLINIHDVKVFSSNYALYGDLSQRVMNLLASYCTEIEVYSIDEAFLNFDGFDYFNLSQYVTNIRKQVHKGTGIPISIGLGQTKALAKLANRIAKKNPEMGGIYILDSDVKRIDALKQTEVGDIWGIGGAFSKYLNKHKIFTAFDFIQSPEAWIRKNMSVVGQRLQKELKGERCIEMEMIQPAKKAICTSRSFGNMQTELAPIEEAVSTFAHRCAEKLRKQHCCANLIQVFIHTNAFRKEDNQYATNKVIQLPVATNSSIELVNYAKLALRSIFKKGYNYKKAGVIVSAFVPEEQIQTDLFDDTEREKHQKIMFAMDNLNKYYGRDTVKLAAQGAGRKWKLRQEQLSPCYTTRFEDILVIKL